MNGKLFEIEIEGDEWEGSVSIRILPQVKRLELSKKFVGSKAGKEDDLDRAKRISQMIKENLEGIDLKHIETGHELKEVDDLDYYGSLSLTTELSKILLQGPPLGNVLKLTSKEQQSQQSTEQQA